MSAGFSWNQRNTGGHRPPLQFAVASIFPQPPKWCCGRNAYAIGNGGSWQDGCTLLMRPARVLRSSVVLRPTTLLHFHQMLIKRKYRKLFSAKHGRRAGPKGPAKELIDAVVEMKRRNPSWGCPRIAEQITLAFGVEIDKDVVRRILAMHFRPESGSGGPSWLT